MSLIFTDSQNTQYDFNELINNTEYKKITTLLRNKAIVHIDDEQTPLEIIVSLYYNSNYKVLIKKIFEIRKTHNELFLFFLKEIFKNLTNESFIRELKNKLNSFLNENNSSRINVLVHVLPYFLYIYLQTHKISSAVEILKEYNFVFNNLILLRLSPKERLLLCYFSGLTLFLNGEYSQAYHFFKTAYLIFPVKFIKSKLNSIANIYGYKIEIENSFSLDHNTLNHFNTLWGRENDQILKSFDHEKVLFFQNHIPNTFIDYKEHGISKIYGIYAISENLEINLIKCYCLIEFLIRNYGNIFLDDNKMIIKSEILKLSYDILNINRSCFDDFLKLIFMKKIKGFYDFKKGVFVIQAMDRGKFDF